MKKISEVKILIDRIFTDQKSFNVFNFGMFQFMFEHFCDGSLQIIPILSYSSEVFLLNFKKGKRNFVLKTKELNKQNKLDIEVNACLVLIKKIKIPEIILHGVLDNNEIAIYEYLEGQTAEKILLKEKEIFYIWKSILDIQDSLCKSSEKLFLDVGKSQKFANKITHYTDFLDKKTTQKIFEIIDEHLNTGLLRASFTVFSDRAPTNWIITSRGIIPIDFDLLLVEPCLSDFVQFIDDPQLCVEYNRDHLIDKCLFFLHKNNKIYFSSEDFHWCAIYRNLIQGAIFYKKNKIVSRFHYKRALNSAIIVNAEAIGKEIKKILKNEVA